MQTENKLETYPMLKLILTVSGPLMVSMLVQSLYNVVDGMFVSNISENALTATSLVYPIQLLMLAVAIGTGVGVNSLLSRTLGKKDFDSANQIAAISLVLALISSFVFIILGIFFTEFFVSLFTDSNEIISLGSQYLRICLIGCSGIFLATTGERLLQATGNTFLSMISQTAGAIVNIVFDPIFIFGLGPVPALGIRGAALATILGQFAAAFGALAFNAIKNKDIHFDFKNFNFNTSIIKEIYIVGIPTMVTQTMGSIMMLCMNAILISYSTTTVAVFSVYYKLWTFVFMPVSGLSQGLLPIIGYNYGARNGKRIMQAFKYTLIIAIIYMSLGTIIFESIPTQLLTLYNADETMMTMGVRCLRVMSIMFPIAAITITIGFACSAMGNGMVSMIGTCLRQLIIPVPLAYLLHGMINIGNLWFVYYVAEILAAIYAIYSFKKEYNKKIRELIEGR